MKSAPDEEWISSMPCQLVSSPEFCRYTDQGLFSYCSYRAIAAVGDPVVEGVCFIADWAIGRGLDMKPELLQEYA